MLGSPDSFVLVNILVTQGTPVKSFVTFKGLIRLEAYLVNTECYFSLSLDFFAFYNSVCPHILCHKLHLDMRRRSAQCKTEELS